MCVCVDDSRREEGSPGSERVSEAASVLLRGRGGWWEGGREVSGMETRHEEYIRAVDPNLGTDMTFSSLLGST